MFCTRQVETPTQLVLENHENTISCQGKLDRKIITFSPTYQLIKIVASKRKSYKQAL